MDKEIKEATEMVKDISAKDILTPSPLPDENLTPYPEVEYKIVEATTMDKLVRDVNAHLKNGRQTEGGVQISTNGTMVMFYQSMIRWVVRSEETDFGRVNKFLENEEDLYEDVGKDVDK